MRAKPRSTDGVNPTLIAALVLAATHLARQGGAAASNRLRSFAGGVGVAYVFVIILPLLASWQGTVRDEMEADRLVFLVALLGLAAYYALDLWATRLDRNGRDGSARAVHLGRSFLYSLAVGFVLADYGERSFVWLVAYTGVVALHFFLSARVSPPNDRPTTCQRVALAAAVVAGWGLSRGIPHPLDLTALLFAAMAGATIIDVLADELPRRDDGEPRWFLLGVGSIVALAFGLRP